VDPVVPTGQPGIEKEKAPAIDIVSPLFRFSKLPDYSGKLSQNVKSKQIYAKLF
jgi:hypothetical protein